MTAVLKLIIETKENVLVVPTGFIQKKKWISTVLQIKDGEKQQTEIETLISTAATTEVTKWLTEWDTIIREVTPTASGSTQKSLFNMPGGWNRGGWGWMPRN